MRQRCFDCLNLISACRNMKKVVHENKSEWNHLIGKLISCSYYSSQHPALCKQPWKPMYLQVLGFTYPRRSTHIHDNWHSAHSPSKNGVRMLINFIPEPIFRSTIKVMYYYYSRWKLFGCTSKVDLVLYETVIMQGNEAFFKLGNAWQKHEHELQLSGLYELTKCNKI